MSCLHDCAIIQSLFQGTISYRNYKGKSSSSHQTDLPHFPLIAGEPRFCCLHQLWEHGTIDGGEYVCVESRKSLRFIMGKQRRNLMWELEIELWKDTKLFMLETQDGNIKRLLRVYSLGIMLKVRWVQQTLHLLTVGKKKIIMQSYFGFSIHASYWSRGRSEDIYDY